MDKKEYMKIYREKNKDKIRQYMKDYNKKYYQNNSDRIKAQTSKYAKANQEKVNKKRKEYLSANADKMKEYWKKYKKSYIQKNKELIKAKNNEYNKYRRATDASFRLRKNISHMVYKALFRQGTSKKGFSFLKYVSWSPEELKIHLESSWEPWMNWDNYGPVKLGERRWNIDHIIPQSALPYSSMTDENFKRCWSLENLRPMEAFANMAKGNKLSSTPYSG